MLTRETFTGLWAGLPVAWTDRDSFDEDTYRGDVRRCCQAGATGIYTGGTTGEFYAMDLAEFKAVARAAVEESRSHGQGTMIGCTSTYTLGAARRAAYAAELGADAIQVALPYWMEVPDDQVVRFCKEVSAASGDLPLSIYDISLSKKTLTVEMHRAIKEALPNYLMVKWGGGPAGKNPEDCSRLSEFVNVFVNEHCWDELGPAGANGCCSAWIYWNPRLILQLWHLMEKKNWPAVRQSCKKLRVLHKFVIDTFAVKGLPLDRIGGRAGGFLKTSLRNRGPYPSATQQDVDLLRRWYEDNFPEMLEWAGTV